MQTSICCDSVHVLIGSLSTNYYRVNIYPGCSRNSEAFASEILETFGEAIL